MACAEVEVDVLTGDHSVVRADVVVDLGRSLNPSLDIGQIEGAFVQGMGWATTEEVKPHAVLRTMHAIHATHVTSTRPWDGID